MQAREQKGSNQTTFGFDTLFSTLPAGQFLKEYFPFVATISHASDAHQVILKANVGVSEPKEIIEFFRGAPMRLWKNKLSTDASADSALAGFATGGAVYIPNAERRYMELAPMLGALCEELGIPASWGSCSLFISRAGAEVPLHFDHDFGFNILVRGQKTWRLARNDEITSPPIGYDASKEPAPALLRITGKPLPTSMPAEHVTIDTSAGAVCFLPRGYWHSTLAHEDCVALDFAIDPPCWAEYISEFVRDQLLLQENGRQSVLGLSSRSAFHPQYLECRETMVLSTLELGRYVGGWSTSRYGRIVLPSSQHIVIVSTHDESGETRNGVSGGGGLEPSSQLTAG